MPMAFQVQMFGQEAMQQQCLTILDGMTKLY